MTNAAKVGLTLAVLVIIIIVGIVWYMASPTAPAAPAPISFNTNATAESTGARSIDTSDAAITSDMASIDSDMNKLNADVASMNEYAVSTSSTASTTSDNVLVQRLNSLRTLTETEKTVLAANLRVDTSARLMGPEIAILIAGDRVYGIVDEFQPLYSKLQARVNQASTTGASTATSTGVHADWTTTLSEIDAKLTDARAQAGKAHDEVIALKPDQGDRATQQINLAALKDARKKILTAAQDLLTARQDAGKISVGIGITVR